MGLGLRAPFGPISPIGTPLQTTSHSFSEVSRLPEDGADFCHGSWLSLFGGSKGQGTFRWDRCGDVGLELSVVGYALASHHPNPKPKTMFDLLPNLTSSLRRNPETLHSSRKCLALPPRRPHRPERRSAAQEVS